MVKLFLNLRLKQISRFIKELGLFRIAFLLVIILFLLFIQYMASKDQKTSFFLTASYLIAIAIFQFNRTDKEFLKIHFDCFKCIFFSEYIIFTTPLYSCLIINKQWLVATFLSCILLMIINIRSKPYIKWHFNPTRKIIPPNCFEWKSGMRATKGFIILIWALGFTTSFFIGSVPITLTLIGIISLSFYEKPEPLQMILSFEMSPKRFLIYKIILNVGLFASVAFPLIFLYQIFHHEYWYIPIIAFTVIANIHVYYILLKYAFYEPNIMFAGNQIFRAIGITSIFIPVIIPVLWLLSVRFYFKSIRILKYYLNDYN